MPTKAIQQSKSPIGTSLLVDLKGAAEILGIACSSVRALIGRHALPVIRAGRGGKLFIPRTALSRFVAGLRKSAS
jgi:hypothetical protein